MAYVEKTTSPEETAIETKVEPEPIFIDEVIHFLSAYIYKSTLPASVYQTVPFSLQGKMDRTLALLQNADPADPAPDSPELIQLEGININAGVNLVAQPVRTAVSLLCSNSVSVSPSNCKIWTGACEQMNPMIDEKLQEIDR